MPKTHFIKNNRGFSLLELIIYMAILIGFLMAITNIFFVITASYAKEEARAEVQQNIRFAAEQIASEINSATAISEPVSAGDSGNVLTVTVEGSPTQFDVSGGVLRKTRGAVVENITSDKVIVDMSSDIFTRIENTNAKPTIQVILTMSYNDDGRENYKFSKTIQTAVFLRN